MIFIGLEFVGGLRESADLEQINNDRHLQIRRLDFSPTDAFGMVRPETSG